MRLWGSRHPPGAPFSEMSAKFYDVAQKLKEGSKTGLRPGSNPGATMHRGMALGELFNPAELYKIKIIRPAYQAGNLIK